jgi:hypothetical protein
MSALARFADSKSDAAPSQKSATCSPFASKPLETARKIHRTPVSVFQQPIAFLLVFIACLPELVI